MKTKLLLASILISLVMTMGIAIAQEEVVTETEDVIKDYSVGTITRDDVKTELSNRYEAGTLTRAGLKTVVTAAYRHGKLQRDDVRFLLGGMYKEGKLTRADLNWILTQAYNQGELTRDDLRYLITKAYKLGELTRDDVKYLVTEAYKRGELKRSDVRWILTHAYKLGDLTRDDLKWLLNEAYKAGELTRDDMRIILTAAYNHGELTRDDVKWLLERAYEEGVLKRDDLRKILTAAYNHGTLTRDDIGWILTRMYQEDVLTKDDLRGILKAAYRHGELRRSDIEWILDKAYELGELTTEDVSIEDVTAEPVIEEPEPVPSVPEITEPNAATAEEATTATTFDETKAAAPAETVLRTEQTWMLYKYALIKIERHRIGMEALIGYVEDLGKDTTKLEELKDEFISQKESLEAAAEENDIEEGRSIIEQMKTTVSSFRTEARALVEDVEAAKAVIQEALEENKDYFDSLLTEAREARRDRNLEIFDLLSARAQGRIDKAKEKGIDVTAAQAKLDEINEKRSELIDTMNDAIAACSGLDIAECKETAEAQAYISLRDDIKNEYRELRDLAREVRQGYRISAAITRANELISNVSARLDTAETRGVDVTAHRAKLDDIQGMVNDAQTKYDAEDFEGAMEDLKAAREAFEALREEARAGRETR